MIKNSPTAAPQVADVNALYEKWIEAGFYGSLNSFYEFLTEPTFDRTLFLSEHNATVNSRGSVVTITFTNA